MYKLFIKIHKVNDVNNDMQTPISEMTITGDIETLLKSGEVVVEEIKQVEEELDKISQPY